MYCKFLFSSFWHLKSKFHTNIFHLFLVYCVKFFILGDSKPILPVSYDSWNGYDIYAMCVCLRIAVSNTYCVVLLFCLSSTCVPYFVSFSGLSIFVHHFRILFRLFITNRMQNLIQNNLKTDINLTSWLE